MLQPPAQLSGELYVFACTQNMTSSPESPDKVYFYLFIFIYFSCSVIFLLLCFLALLACNAVAVMFSGASSFCRPDVRMYVQMSGCKTGTPTVFKLESSAPREMLTYL